MTGTLNAKANAVLEAFSAEEDAGVRRLGQTRQSMVLAAEYDTAFDAGAEVVLRLMALPRRAWSDLKEEHPPRVKDGDTHPDDDDFGVNVRTFFDAVMPQTVVEDSNPALEPRPVFTPVSCATFCDNLSHAEWTALTQAVWVLNERGVGVPKSSMVTLLRRQITDESEPPDLSESPSPVSTGGNRLAGPTITTQTET